MLLWSLSSLTETAEQVADVSEDGRGGNRETDWGVEGQ